MAVQERAFALTMLRPRYLVISPLPLQELAAFVLTMARPEAIDRAASGEFDSIKHLSDSWGRTWGQALPGHYGKNR